MRKFNTFWLPLLAFCCLLLASANGFATIRYIKPIATGLGDGSSWGNAGDDLQAAINTSAAGDVVWVTGGTYKPNRKADAIATITPADRDNAFVIKADVKLYGGFAGTEATLAERDLDLTANKSILSGDFNNDDVVSGSGKTLTITGNTENAYHVVVSAGEVGMAVLDGFTVIGGNANVVATITTNGKQIDRRYGGGIILFDSNLTLTNIIASGNYAWVGGGVFCQQAFSQSVSFSHVIFSYNYSGNGGGGLYNGSIPVIDNATFTGNYAIYGGGLYNNDVFSKPQLTNVVFSGNYASTYGGGLYNRQDGKATLDKAAFMGNSARAGGGGMYNTDFAITTLTNSIFYGNYSGSVGGGIVNIQGSELIVRNSVFAGNNAVSRGGALFNGGSTFSSSSRISNCIVYGNNTALANGGFAGPSVVSYSIVQGGFAGTGNLDTDPLFVSAPSYTTAPFTVGDYRLQGCSPAINSGNNDSVPVGITTDYAGNARIYNDYLVDMGAYEYQAEPATIELANNLDAATVAIDSGNIISIRPSAAPCHIIATLVSTGANAARGSLDARVWVDAVVQRHTYSPYVQRHYEITPATNAATATAQLTLYFTQAEFDAYNTAALASVNLWVPGDPNDAVGMASLRIVRYAGISVDGSGTPASYGVTGFFIDPDDNDIVWNAALSRWEVTFTANGFGGFFVAGVQSGILPVRMVSFTGTNTGRLTNRLRWLVEAQDGMQEYVLERSTDGSHFEVTGKVAASQMASTAYTYNDEVPADKATYYYRLRLVGIAGTTTYSQVIAVPVIAMSNIYLYPVPATDVLWLAGDDLLSGTEAVVTDLQGKALQRVRIAHWPQRVPTEGLPAGIYLVRLANGLALKMIISR